MLPVVAALKAHPNGRSLVPASLWRYFDEHLLVSAWYPERDYFALLEALIKTIDAKAVGGDVWRYFAKFSVKQDVAGGPGAGGAAAGKGVYRNFGTSAAGAPEQLFRRAVKLWSQYHDTGTMQITGWRTTTERVVMQLVGLAIPIEGFVRLQGYYLEENRARRGRRSRGTVTRSTAREHLVLRVGARSRAHARIAGVHRDASRRPLRRSALSRPAGARASCGPTRSPR